MYLCWAWRFLFIQWFENFLIGPISTSPVMKDPISWFTKTYGYIVYLNDVFRICMYNTLSRYIIYETYKQRSICFVQMFAALWMCDIFSNSYLISISFNKWSAWYTKASLGPRQTSKMKVFEKIVDGFQLITIFAKSSILDIWQGSEYASVTYFFQILLICKNGVIISQITSIHSDCNFAGVNFWNVVHSKNYRNSF